MLYSYKNNDTIEDPTILPSSWENISGLNNLGDDDLRALGWYPVTFAKDISQGDQVYVSSTRRIEKDVVVQTDFYRSYNDQELADLKRDLEISIKKERDQLLANSDYTQLSDVTIENKADWISYRQALRDITNQAGFPDNVTWPTIPKGF